MKKLYEGRGCEPNPKLGEKQYYLDAWDLRRLYSFALRQAEGCREERPDTSGFSSENDILVCKVMAKGQELWPRLLGFVPPRYCASFNNIAEAQPVRELFAIIKALRDAEDGEASADSSAGGEGEEEEDGEDDPVSEESENPRSVARVSDKAVEDQDDGGGVKAVLGDLGLKPNEDAPAPAFRYRSKSTLSSLALGGPNSRDILETPGSYKASLPDNTEEELQRILEQIRLYEDGESKDPDTARHDALLLMMGSPARPGTSRGLA